MSLRERAGNHTEQPPKTKKMYMENQISKNHSERNATLFQWSILWAHSGRCYVFPTYFKVYFDYGAVGKWSN